MSKFRWRERRIVPLAVLALVFAAGSFLVRLVFAFSGGDHAPLGAIEVVRAFALGLYFDLAAFTYAAFPFVLYLLLAPGWMFHRRWHRAAWLTLCWALVFGMLFLFVAEWFFWQEFRTRFNFIAVDYLLYTREVIGNIRESYPVGRILMGLGALAAVIVWLLRRPLTAPMDAPRAVAERFRHRLAWAVPLLAAPMLAFWWVDHSQREFSANPLANELAGDGLYEFFSAAYRNDLDYVRHYASLDPAKARALLRARLETPHAKFAAGTAGADSPDLVRQVSYPGPERKLNVVLVSVESLSADFMARFGNDKGITPRLDALSHKAMFFTRLYATGTRTVRGLEALSVGYPPTPGQSIVKRPHNDAMFTLGSVFKGKGYDVRYLYGGYAYFDNMRDFFAGNGYVVEDRTVIPAEKIHHENIWGVADEDLFTMALERADAAHARGQPFFHQVMTTTNHRPFTYPDGRIDIPSKTSRDGAVKYTDWAIGDFIERAAGHAWFKDTVFVVVADHCASSAGKSDVPINRYLIPMLIYSPGHIEARTVDRLMSQIDIPPTLLGLLGFSYRSQFLGYDLFDLEPGRERAFVSTYQELGFMRADKLVVLRPGKRVSVVKPDPRDGSATPARPDASLTDEAIAWYQVASQMFAEHRAARLAGR
ncbi:MAG: sulfatase-like hydrolase/transferase [Betaproteobacteria bacterium]